MTDKRTTVTVASVVLALLCASWAVHVSRQSARLGRVAAPQGAARTAPRGGAPAIPVLTAAAQTRAIDVAIEAIGTANSNEAVSLTAKVTNIVTAIRFTDGQSVKAGEVLVELDRAQVSADLDAAVAAYEESRSQFKRSQELMATRLVSQSQYEQLDATMKANAARAAAARARLADTYIRAPFAGRVGLRRISPGSLISPGTVITTLDDSSSIKVDFAVPESNLGELRVGQTVATHAAAWPGRKFSGRVISIDSRVDAGTRAVTVRALVPNADHALRPGMFLNVALSSDRRSALLIPEEALVPEQARQFVYVLADDHVTKREVTLGRREPGVVEITAGLAAGERVVVEGTLKLRDGAEVREATLPVSTADPRRP
jgi:membrane fusion protein (multidrug efflux system)